MTRRLRVTACAVVLLLISLVAASSASAQRTDRKWGMWDDRSDELPGITSGKTLLIASAVVVGAFVIYKLATRDGGGGNEASGGGTAAEASLQQAIVAKSNQATPMWNPTGGQETDRRPVGLQMGIGRAARSLGAFGVTLGLSVYR